MFQILIVEDDKELSQLFQKVLEKNGYQVKSASDGAQALEVLDLSLIHISEPTRLRRISYAVFCLKKKIIRKEIPSNAT